MKKQITTPCLRFKEESKSNNLLSTIFRPDITRGLLHNSKNLGNAILVLFALLSTFYSQTVSAQTCASYTSGRAYVKATATGANNGTSWNDAFTTLQGALTVAAACPGVTQVWVAAGTYLPTQTSINMSSLYPRHLAFNMRNGLAIYGGFNGTETLLNQRNYISNVTTLSGDIGVPGDNSDNCVHVITNYSLNSTAVLDGFTITGGNANTGDPYVTNQFGGGMYNETASPTISNCIFTGNAAVTFGGGMDNSSGSPVVTNCTFTGNSANFGGGMNNTGSNTSLTNCVFSLNTANSSGGGLYNQSGSNGVLSKCTFKQNTANGLGGGLYNLNSTPGLTNCIFIGNTANSGGGGMFNQLGSSAITNCSFSGNTGTTGGALYSISGTPALKNCILWNNSSGITGTPVVTYSIIQGTGVYAGTGNLNANPLFVSSTDLHLQFGSPAYNAGTNTGAPTTDIEGTSRPLSVANPADMGAYEYVLLPPTLGTYANTTIISGQSTTITPAGAPTSTAYTVAFTNTRFTGLFSVNPTTGVVTVTDAMQAGTYTVTVKASNNAGSATTTFTLTVTNPNCSGGLFGPPTIINCSSYTYELQPGDFNQDGILDLAVLGGSDVTIYLGTGTGSFSAAGNYTLGSYPNSLKVGDFNGDGHQDLAAGDYLGYVYILLGSGTGTFSAATSFATVSNVNALVIGDFNNDGKQDLAISNGNDGSVSIYPGTGTGSFGAAITSSIGIYHVDLAIGDFNGDGNQDIAATNVSSNTVSICLGTGTGSLGTPTAYAVGASPISVAIGDFNGDGIQDFAVANFDYSSNSVSIGLGTGTGTFGPVTNYPTGSQPHSVSIGDFNGDGKQDLAIPNYFTNDLSILLGTGTGSFGAATSYPEGINARYAAIGDFNGDGRQDIAVTNDGTNSIYVHLNVANEINVQGGSPLISIVDGDATPGAADDTEYGNVLTGNNAVHNFTIQNSGNTSLAVSAVYLSGGDAGMFSVGALSPALPIAAGGSATFPVTFAPSSTGLKTTTVHITNTDCDEADYDFTIQGTGTCTSLTWYLDTDNDTHYVSTTSSCTSPGLGYNTTGGTSGDCNDNNNTVWQSASFYIDVDADGYDSGSEVVCYGATIPSGYSTTTLGSDCKDNDASVHVVQTWYLDSDGDTYYVSSLPSCVNPGAGYNTAGGTLGDCDDSNNAVWQSASLYIDADVDGYDDGAQVVCYGATIPSGYSATTNGSDCDDNNSLAHSVEIWYLDADGDTYYVSSVPSCGSPGAGYNTTGGTSGDCDDNNNAAWQSASLYIDVDADGYDSGTQVVCYGASIPSGYSVSSNGSDCDDTDNTKWQSASLYIDADADGYDAGSSAVCYGATIPSGYSSTSAGTDCDDDNGAVNPSATEICNSIDDNCNTQVDENGVPASVSTSDAVSFCDGGSALLEASLTGAGYSYQWYEGANAIEGAINNSYTADASGNYSLQITFASCTGTSNTISVTENPLPVASITPANPLPICKGIPILLSANTGDGLIYQWYSFVNPIAGETNATYMVAGNNQKKYMVTVTNSFGCAATSNVVDINRLATPKAIIEILNPVGNPDLCINGQVRLRANGGPALGYQWRKNGNDIPNATNRSYYATTTGNYRVTVTNLSTGCSDLSPVVSVVAPCKEADIVNLKQTALNMYPNPTNGHFILRLNVSNEPDGSAVVHVFNALGQLVIVETVPVKNGEMIKELSLANTEAAGMYLVRVVFNGQVFKQQLIYQQ